MNIKFAMWYLCLLDDKIKLPNGQCLDNYDRSWKLREPLNRKGFEIITLENSVKERAVELVFYPEGNVYCQRFFKSDSFGGTVYWSWDSGAGPVEYYFFKSGTIGAKKWRNKLGEVLKSAFYDDLGNKISSDKVSYQGI